MSQFVYRDCPRLNQVIAAACGDPEKGGDTVGAIDAPDVPTGQE
jgi:hypothetical protein